MTRLTGVTWDHPRGYGPLEESGARFGVHWERRSLARFGGEPLEALAERYDLIVIDHPFCGAAADSGWLRDLRSLISSSLLEELKSDSVGPSTESYWYGDGVWALPTDAAAHVAAYRPDLLRRLDAAAPRSFNEVISLAERARRDGRFIAVPLCPGDAICTFLTLLANLGAGLEETAELDVKTAVAALWYLSELKELSHPASIVSNPIAVYEHMSRADDVVYVPFAFGYSNYARGAKSLGFCDIAGPGSDPSAGALLGGAGCAITMSCRDVESAVEYLEFLHSGQYQTAAYFQSGGQPGRLSAWQDRQINEASSNFFLGTLQTMQKSYLRPRFAAFVPFMERAGVQIRAWLCEGGSASGLAETLRRGYDEARTKGASQT